MAEKNLSNLNLTPDEQKTIDEGFNTIKSVLNKKNINIENIIGLVTAQELQATSKQVKVKFAEKNESAMNMIAFS